MATASIDNFLTILEDAPVKLIKRFSSQSTETNDDKCHLTESNSDKANMNGRNCESSGS